MALALYLEDAYRRSFDAQVVGSRPAESGWEVALDQTCFYPAGGGQPADTGTLGGLPVVDVREEGGQVWHALPELPAAPTLHGEIDWQRRFDHMQQHSGQHILSAVALERLGAQTVSFHLGAEAATIDLDLPNLSPADAQLLEDATTAIVLADAQVRAFLVDPDDIPRLSLRKPPTKGDRPRIVEIAGVDRSPCGGTHVASTGQIGLAKVRRLERYKGGTRLEFLCGWRAVRDYQWKHMAIAGLARDLSVAEREVEDSVRRALAGEKEARRQADLLRGQLLDLEAAALRREGRPLGPASVIVRALAQRSPAEVKQLASLLVSQPHTVALLAAQAPSVRLFFMRSPDLELDMRELLRSVTARFGGGGGGRPESAEGGGLPVEQVTEALTWAARQLGDM